MKLIDIGINLTNRQFSDDIEEVIGYALKQEVDKMIFTGTSVHNSKASLLIAKKYPGTLYATAGIHPHEAKGWNAAATKALQQLLEHKEVVAVGECGLDFDRDFSPRNIQEQCFAAQVQLACEVQKPLFLHERAAFGKFNEVIAPYRDLLPPAVVHCFTGTLQEARQYLDNGFYLGFTGAVSDTRRFAHLESVLKYVPLDRMMIETDAPFMLSKNVPSSELFPEKPRRNEPGFLKYVVRSIAAQKGIRPEQVAEASTQNAKAFFGF
ncbi:hydrolase TatD [Taibaiella sp. KBW10]|uniref:TatD family hydrolase n=1 Tax=Taibaiella sp. KBW10 TaxID=2153357 RepID=UPI000F5A691C|nr:TatD family hydrolase [Taibaiella sp. KBW10]RQO30274.1 hydrolase TatD [Taibaiella sp. KBW10]